MPGLDPGIHAVPFPVRAKLKTRSSAWQEVRSPCRVDGRVKPGHDDGARLAKSMKGALS